MAVKGIIENLDLALREYLDAYQPGALGLDGVSTCVIALPVPEWSVYGWSENPTISLTAAQVTDEPVFTLPLNERAWLQYFIAERSTGDNNIGNLGLTMPAEYRSGAALTNVCTAAVAGTKLFWPDIAGIVSLDSQAPSEPILLEPGSILSISPDGTGASASTWACRLLMKRMKLVRAQAPY